MKTHTSNRIYLLSLVALFLIMLLAVQAKAGKLTLSNKAGVPAQYTTWTDAYNAAQPGDTIFMMPSPTSYGSINLFKGLTLIGTGHRSINEQFATERVVIDNITLSAGSSGTSVIGLSFSGLYTPRYIEVDDITVKNCQVRYEIRLIAEATARNWVIEGNVFTAARPIHFWAGRGNLIGGRISNNLFMNNAHISSMYNSTVLITNNVFLGNWSGATAVAFSSCNNLTVSNNIFIGRHIHTNLENCTFTNNLWYAENQTAIEVPNNFFAYNIIDQQPLFANYDASTHNGNYDINATYDFDFSLQSGSPGAGAGTDGGNMGLRPNFSLTGTPANPQITFLQALSTIVEQDGTINVKLKAVSGSN